MPSLGLALLAACLCLFVVHASMELMAALLTEYPPTGNAPAAPEALRRRLLTLGAERGYRIVADGAEGLRVEFDVVDPAWAAQFARVRLSDTYTARLALDPDRHELRLHEAIRSWHIAFGLPGWWPRFAFSAGYFAGPMELVWSGRAYGLVRVWPPKVGETRDFVVDTRVAKNDVRAVLRDCRWALRPVFFGFQVGAPWAGIRRLTPGFISRMPGTQFWGTAAVSSYVVVLAALIGFAGPVTFTRSDWALVLLVTGAWWGMWCTAIVLLRRRGRVLHASGASP